MKFTVNDSHRPELSPGQLWRHLGTDKIYLAVGRTAGIYLVNAHTFATGWSGDKGFGTSDNEFEYIGVLKLEDY